MEKWSSEQLCNHRCRPSGHSAAFAAVVLGMDEVALFNLLVVIIRQSRLTLTQRSIRISCTLVPLPLQPKYV